jgi:hypothetical protein
MMVKISQNKEKNTEHSKLCNLLGQNPQAFYWRLPLTRRFDGRTPEQEE